MQFLCLIDNELFLKSFHILTDIRMVEFRKLLCKMTKYFQYEITLHALLPGVVKMVNG